MMHEKYLEAGQIVNTHGVKGEVKITPWADTPEFLTRFKTLYIDGAPVAVKSIRVHGAFVIAALEGCTSVNDAMALKGKIIYIDRNDVRLPKGRFFIADIIGAKVVSDTGDELGTLAEVLEMPAQNIYVVRGTREIMIPDVPEFILNVDPVNGVVTVHLIDGM